MVYAKSARDDVNNVLLTKTIVYRRFSTTIEDLSTGETLNNTYDDYNVKAQCSIQNNNSELVQDGVLTSGDLLLLLKYQYEYDEDGLAIDPKLIPRIDDKIKYIEQWFQLKDVTPLTSEDDLIIGWECRAIQLGMDEYDTEPYETS
jgi:hypothetical protein